MNEETKRPDKEASLAGDPVGRLLFKLAIPAIAAQIINVLYNIVDRMFIGHIEGIGADALTGVGVTMPVIMAVSAFAYLAGMGGAPRAAIMMGKNQKEEAEKILGNCFLLLLCLSAALTAVILVFGRDILMAFGASENTIGYASDYLNIYALGTVFVQVTLGLNAFITAQGYAGISMITVLIGALLNTALDPVFIFALDMGVKGAAVATVISQAVSALWAVLFLVSGRPSLRLKASSMIPRLRIIGPCVALGLSPFVMQFTESIISVCFNSSLLKYGGDTAVGAMSILATIMQFMWLPMQGMTQGAQPVTSYNYGAGNYDRVKKSVRLLIFSCLAYSTVLWAVCMFIPEFFIHFFTNDRELVDAAVWAIRIYMAAALLFGVQAACQQSFIALGNARTSIFLAVFRKIIMLIPLIFILPLFMEDKVAAVFLAEPAADLCAVSLTSLLFFRAYRKLGRQEKKTPPS
ncbi:MAG TPA: MATE family efflux transporter [Candidatus Copromorpha excrementigallinarum]|uniref:Multidrug export protein MepA n=1 Tax=Candidatus Allocopromorpha excrementigallinarum TaxID=2840742 RepID=A0A9D1I1F4_9FIRM|nr:MATE family efflux transporter [Candidatus Copromorpha excrementigallinarum]